MIKVDGLSKNYGDVKAVQNLNLLFGFNEKTGLK